MTLVTKLGYLFAVAAIAASLTACGSSSQSTATITGKYKTTIPPDGTYTLNFEKNGAGTTSLNGQLTPHNFTWKGTTLTSPGGGPNVCPTVGTYRIHLAGKHLRLTVIHDTCTIGRAQVLPGHIWTKVG